MSEESEDPVMHELFLTAHVPNDDLDRSLRILQGYCSMRPVSLLRRRLVWEGPRTRQLKGIDPAFITRQGQRAPFWRSLHEQLTRQSYVITLIYDVNRELFGKGEANGENGSLDNSEADAWAMDCDQLPGALRWNDLPGPAGARPVNSRLILNIEGEKNLCTTMKSMNHRFTKEIIQECYRFVHGNVVFDLSRYLQIPQEGHTSMSYISTRLPLYESLAPFDSENKWILMANVGVSNGNDPDQMQRGIEELITIKTEFEGCFDFQVLDRHIFDTRVKF